VDQDDLLGHGTIGLVEAVDNFDPARGVKFESYARTRIHGRIIDSLRTLDLLPRSARRGVKEMESAISHLSLALGRTPTDEEVAGYLGVTVEQYRDRLIDANSAIISLDQPLSSSDGEEFTLSDSLADTNALTPTEEMDKKDLKVRLASAIRALSEREQFLVSLYYRDELTMKEIGQVLGLSESRVSQMHAKALLTLLNCMKDDATPKATTYTVQGNRALLQQLYRPHATVRPQPN
jgi:RNA polymerase sigma factor for flagellar operon FliA